MKSLRILALADLHDCVERVASFKKHGCDLIIFCGDLHNASIYEKARPAALALSRLGRTVLIVPGNMDHKDVVPNLWKETGLEMLHKRSYRYGDYGFIGMGGMVVRNPRRVGDPARYYHLDEDVYGNLSCIYPEIGDLKRKIVVTHQPPRGAQDIIYSGERTGSAGLRHFVEEFGPDLLICGHIHEDRGESWIGSTKIVNVGEMREGYGALIDLNDEIKVNWIEP